MPAILSRILILTAKSLDPGERPASSCERRNAVKSEHACSVLVARLRLSDCKRGVSIAAGAIGTGHGHTS